jgi:hypothetical protein
MIRIPEDDKIVFGDCTDKDANLFANLARSGGVVAFPAERRYCLAGFALYWHLLYYLERVE